MKLKELRELISSIPEVMDDCEVILQKDAEGNGYSPLEGLDPDAIWVPYNSYDGEVWSTNWSAADADMSEEEWEEFKGENVRRLVLHPVN